MRDDLTLTRVTVRLSNGKERRVAILLDKEEDYPGIAQIEALDKEFGEGNWAVAEDAS